MSEERDPYLQSLFSEVEELDDRDFMLDVQNRIRAQERSRWLVLAGLLFAGSGVVWVMSVPLSVAAESLTLGLTSPLVKLGEGFLPLMLSPINNLASILILIAKLLRMGWKRIRTASYAT